MTSGQKTALKQFLIASIAICGGLMIVYGMFHLADKVFFAGRLSH